MDIKEERKELNVFCIVAFGVHYITSIFMVIRYYHGAEDPVIGALMYLPAAGVILSAFIIKKYLSKPYKFFSLYWLISILVILFVELSAVFPDFNLRQSINILNTVGGPLLLLLIMLEKQEILKIWGLNYNRNKCSHPAKYIIYFSILLLIRDLLVAFMAGDLYDFGIYIISTEYLFSILSFPIFMIFGYANFFGEEYGWRYYLQTFLQKKYGPRKGIIILGLCWCIWHLPFCFLTDNPRFILIKITEYLITCMTMSIYFGYVYMRTKNIWIIILLHMINNAFSLNYIIEENYHLFQTWKGLIIVLIANFIVFIPAIFSKTFNTIEVEKESK